MNIGPKGHDDNAIPAKRLKYENGSSTRRRGERGTNVVALSGGGGGLAPQVFGQLSRRSHTS